MFSPPTTTSRQLRRRQQNFTWDHGYMYESELAPISPFNDPRTMPFADPHPNTTTTTFDPIKTPTDLPSRVNALNRRAAIVSAYLAHLTAVIKPLQNTKAEDLSDNHLRDMVDEGMGLREAMEGLTEQMDEVLDGLDGLLRSKRKVGKGKGGGMGRNLAQRKPLGF